MDLLEISYRYDYDDDDDENNNSFVEFLAKEKLNTENIL